MCLDNRVRGEHTGTCERLLIPYVDVYVYCAHSQCTRCSKQTIIVATPIIPSSLTYTTDLSTKRQIAHNTQRAPAKLRVRLSIPTCEISSPDNPIGSAMH